MGNDPLCPLSPLGVNFIQKKEYFNTKGRFHMEHEVYKVEWSNKGKKYKTKYFTALKELYGALENDKDNHDEIQITHGSTRTDQIGRLVDKNGD